MTVVGFAGTADSSTARGVRGADHPHAPGAAREAPQDGDGVGGGPKDDGGDGGGHYGGEQIDSGPEI